MKINLIFDWFRESCNYAAKVHVCQNPEPVSDKRFRFPPDRGPPNNHQRFRSVSTFLNYESPIVYCLVPAAV